MGSTSINSSINSHVPFYSSVNSYSSDNLNENSNYTNSSQNNQQNASPASNEDSLLTNSDLAPYKPIFNYELAFTNYSKPNSCSLLELSETNETKLETYSNSIDIDISITTSIAPGSPGAIVDNSIQDNNIYSSTLVDTVQNENQSPNDNANSQSSIPSEQLVNGHSFIPMEKVELQQPSDLNTIQEESNEKESSLYSIDSIDLTVEEETDIIVDPSIFKPKVKDSLDQSPDQDSKSSDSDSSSPSKKVTKKRKKPRKNYFAPPKKSKPKAKKAEEEEENMLNLALTDELDFITKENTEKNIISLREKNYVTVIKKASEKPNEELDNNMGGEDNGDEFDSDYDDDTPRQRSKKSRKITWNTTPQYKEFHKNQSITLGERFCSPVKSKAEKPKKSCISRKAPFNSPNTKKPKKSRPLSPVTVTRIIYSKK